MKYRKRKLRFVVAESEELRNAIHRLRYQVYVEQYKFERAEDHPGGLERDEYEPYSIHMAALDSTDQVVGTIRLVLHSEKGFPVEKVTRINFIGKKPPPQRMGEISRLAVAHTYRQRKENGFAGVESYLPTSEGGALPDTSQRPINDERRKKPAIVLGLYRVMYQESKRLGITHWYMITEKKVWYALKKYGFLFHQVGEPVEYHGTRVPYVGVIEEFEKNLYQTNPAYLRLFLTGLEKEYHPPESEHLSWPEERGSKIV